MAVGDQNNPVVYQFTISGSRGTKVGSTAITGFHGVSQFWKQGPTIVVVEGGGVHEGAGFWPYPAGGKATKILSGLNEPAGTAVSLSK